MSPEELSAWLAQARRLFGEAFSLESGVCLRVIVANARNPRQAVEYRIPEIRAQERVIAITETIAVHVQPGSDAGQVGVTVAARGLPLLSPVQLSDDERAVVRACLTERLTGKRLCSTLRWEYNGTSRTVFARLVHEKKCLERTSDGYFATDVGRLSVGISTGEV